jgi:hypothetical protein
MANSWQDYKTNVTPQGSGKIGFNSVMNGWASNKPTNAVKYSIKPSIFVKYED